jgi:radical SAM superfamily enzyme YgiQ (UPF0313 family)
MGSNHYNQVYLNTTVFAITPPFTQLNTPYPATAYLKGFLNTKAIACRQADLGIEVILELYSKKGFEDLFAYIEKNPVDFSDNALRIIGMRHQYIHTIDSVISFLQGHNATLVHQICQKGYLPEASRFEQLETYHGKTFGSMRSQDEAKHLATLYIEDISDLIKECVDPHFGFSRYAERLGRSANSFDEIYQLLQHEYSYIDLLLVKILEIKMTLVSPKLVAISVPFPGNLFSAFRCAQWIKKYHPEVKIAMGGGFANTELRSLSDARVFEFFDFITLDDGERPLECLVNYVSTLPSQSDPGKNIILESDFFKRTFMLVDGQVEYLNNSPLPDYPQAQTGTPDYSDLLLDSYISVIEIVNPMHRLWSDGRWNKLTLAHGCYWGKCTFCDTSLDYIKVFEPLAAQLICDRMEEMISQTGQSGFHFVDEAAPPARMRDLALEILKRKLNVTWWTNIRFEKSFNRDLCKLLKASGCIAVSGGLEVASDRLLELIQKGVTVAQVAQVCRNFTECGIMVHAYLMYGFPTQTTQETIDSLEMVRQMFEAGIIQSGFWHQFAMTVHSPVGLYPDLFKVQKSDRPLGTFANNDLEFKDPTGTDHDAFSYGLKKSILNYMHGLCFDYRLQDWFEFKVPKDKIEKTYIKNVLLEKERDTLTSSSKIVWIGNTPEIKVSSDDQNNLVTVTVHENQKTTRFDVEKKQADWLVEILKLTSPQNSGSMTYKNLKEMYDEQNNRSYSFEKYWESESLKKLRAAGLLVL